MLKTILNWVLSAVIIMLTAWLVPGISVAGFLSALLVVLVITVVNAFIKPLIKITSLPFNAVVLAIFTLVINALLFMIDENQNKYNKKIEQVENEDEQNNFTGESDSESPYSQVTEN